MKMLSNEGLIFTYSLYQSLIVCFGMAYYLIVLTISKVTLSDSDKNTQNNPTNIRLKDDSSFYN